MNMHCPPPPPIPPLNSLEARFQAFVLRKTPLRVAIAVRGTVAGHGLGALEGGGGLAQGLGI